MPRHSIELNQELYIEVTPLYRDTQVRLVPYIVVKVNLTNFHAIPKARLDEYREGARVDFLRLRIHSNTLKVMNSRELYSYKVWLEKEQYTRELNAIAERKELMQLAQARLESMTVEELKQLTQY